MKRIQPWKLLIPIASMLSMPGISWAMTHIAAAEATAANNIQDEGVIYPADFFRRYQPTTALDMVQHVPGFQLDEGDDKRGFGSAAGNILINNRRPSAKQDSISAILGRIPAANVERIEMVRGQDGGLDLAGYSVVANVFVREASRASVRWEAYVEKNLEPKPMVPGGSISLSNRWADIDYNLGFDARQIAWGDVGTDEIFDAQNELTEIRTDDFLSEGHEYSVILSTSTYLGDVLFQSNVKFRDQSTDRELISLRVPQLAGVNATDEIFNTGTDTREFELGIDAERKLSSDLAGKAIFLYSLQNIDEIDSQRSIDAAGDQTEFRSAATDKVAREAIARLELDWSGFSDHAVQFNLEGAFNSLDGSLVQTEDAGSGLINVPVPGANTLVEEERVDVLIKDNWSLGRFELAYGLGAEISRITQTGDAELERSFTYIKPEALLTYSPGQDRQTRFRIAREVSQLNFDDFISATVFEDDDLALGNPNLQPETTWVAELSHERRFGDFSVTTVTVFHHWISEVEDLLPLSTTFEAPGNIGSGRRWGVEFEGTVPMDWSGLTGARLDIKARWQDSQVTDPVTGRTRVLSSKSEGGPSGEYAYLRNETEYALILNFRQDVQAARVAWGWTMKTRTERPYFKVNELEILDENFEVNAFVESTRWWGLKVRFEVNRIFEIGKRRDRTLYVGERELTARDRFIRRSRDNGRELLLKFSGAF